MQKLALLIVSVLIALQLHADVNKDPQKKTIVLNMIVKNESEVIEKCLGSVKNIIDYWVIVDTGSLDGTQEVIKKFMQGIPGELHERPWINFAHNRNEALVLAKGKGDYVLHIDADEVLQYAPSFTLPKLDKDCYYMVVRQLDAVDFKRAALVNNHIEWKWEGVLHEFLTSSESKTFDVLHGLLNVCNTHTGGRSKDPQKYAKDAEVFEKALKKEPNNPRYVFYLAQSYYAAKNFKMAKKNYEKRAAMASDDEQETFFAIYNVGQIEEKLGNPEAALQQYFKAHTFRPIRSEPLFRAAVVYRKQGNFLLGYLVSKYALSLPYPGYDTCVEYKTYDYALLVEFANCALLSGKYDEGLEASLRLLANPNLPEEIKPQVLANCDFARTRLAALAAK